MTLGIAPYNGVIAVAANSRIVPPANHQDDHHYRDVQLWAEMVGDRLKTVAPIRIDCRRQVAGGPFYMFDVNMKPVSSNQGRIVSTRESLTIRIPRTLLVQAGQDVTIRHR
jgi:hypothetical protein